jgi:hypothetical protein
MQDVEPTQVLLALCGLAFLLVGLLVAAALDTPEPEVSKPGYWEPRR